MLLQQGLSHFDFDQQNRVGQSFVDEDLRGANDLLLVALRKDDALRIAFGLIVNAVHQAARAAEELLEASAISVVVGDRLQGHTRLRRRTRHRHRNVEQHAIVERLGDQIVAAEGKAIRGVRAENRIGYFFFGQIGEGARRGKLHLLVDRRGPGVKRSAKDERKSENVVDLVRVIGAAGGHDHVAARRSRVVIRDFRIGIGHGEDDGILRHRADHVGRDDPADRQSDEHVGPFHRIGQRPAIGVRGELLLVRRHVDGATFEDHAVAVGEDDVRFGQPHL